MTSKEATDEVLQLNKDLTEAKEHIAALHLMYEVAQSLSSEHRLDKLLRMILSGAIHVTGADAGSLLLLDEENDELVFEFIEGGGGEELEGTRMSRHQGIAGWVLEHGKGLIVDDVNRDSRYYQDIAKSLKFPLTSLLCVPMLANDEAVGVLQVLYSQSGNYFGKKDEQLLMTFATQSAIALKNARLYENLSKEQDRLFDVEHEIRRRLARDLHDGPTQLLAAVVMNLNFIKELVKRAKTEIAFEEINETIGTAERALKQLRTLLFDLRPVVLETKGLIPALQIYTKRIEETEDLEVVLNTDIDASFRLSGETEEIIFSVVQEAINNAKKHAEASQIRVSFNVNKLAHEISVSVEDDGVGFDIDDVEEDYDERGSLGMLNMKERAEAIGGKLKIDSKLGKGTKINLIIPLY